MRNLVKQIKTANDDMSELENVTQQFIANLSDNTLIFLKYTPSLHRVEAYLLNKVSDIDFSIKKVQYEGIVYTNFYAKVQHNQNIVMKKFDLINQPTYWIYFNPLVIFKIMNKQYFPIIMMTNVAGNYAVICHKGRSNPVLVNQDMTNGLLPIINLDELSKLATFCIKHNTINIKIFRQIYNMYMLSGNEKVIARIIPIHALLQ